MTDEVIEIGWGQFEGGGPVVADVVVKFADAGSECEDGVGISVDDVQVTPRILGKFIDLTILSNFSLKSCCSLTNSLYLSCVM